MRHAPDELSRLSDEKLMRLVADLDAGAFEILYDRHVAAVYGLCRRMVRSTAQAEDICQDAFLSVWRSGGRYDPKLGNVRSWMLSITHNRAIDQIRRSRRHDDRQIHDDALAERMPGGDSTDGEALDRIQADATGRALRGLPDSQRAVIELSFYSGYSHTEIADRLELPLGTVKGRMRLGLEKLQGQLSKAA
ncbi:MAG TPA: sigma-70 family RNA polymerase sigma factor [Solirubrobacteraceae bacterium]|nr:sigma-70 family RNA polymerase sigma factor [Solirubrobacteraceae bacterium]